MRFSDKEVLGVALNFLCNLLGNVTGILFYQIKNFLFSFSVLCLSFGVGME